VSVWRGRKGGRARVQAPYWYVRREFGGDSPGGGVGVKCGANRARGASTVRQRSWAGTDMSGLWDFVCRAG